MSDPEVVASPAEAPAGSSSSSAELGEPVMTYSGLGWGDLEVKKLNKDLEEQYGDEVKLGNVQTLNLSHNPQLRGGASSGPLEDLLEKLPNLTRLDLGGCNTLRELPDAIATQCPKLKELNLNGCTRLMRLPPKLGELVLLQTLDMKNCEMLEALPPTIGGCAALTRLYVSQATAENGMTAIPESLCDLRAIEHLELGCSILLRSMSALVSLRAYAPSYSMRRAHPSRSLPSLSWSIWRYKRT